MSTLTETVQRPLREARVDPESGVISGVKIAGRHSQNGRVYLKPAFKEALDLYRDAPVRVDHGSKGKGPSFDETIAVVKHPRARNDGLWGDLHVVDRGDRGAKLLALAEAAPSVFGLSHEASGKVERGGRGENDKVREITKVQAVSLVGSPATTSGLFESDTSAAELVESVREREPDLAEVRSRLFSDYSAPAPREIMEEVAERAPAGDDEDLARVKDRLFT